MTWKDRLQDASFRGVPFKVEEESAGTGRRVETHEYPNRDKPYTEDLGKITFRPSITAYVVGDDCFDQRDRLIDALNKPGPGTLVHPTYGELKVCVDGEVRVSTSKSEGRIVRFEWNGWTSVRIGAGIERLARDFSVEITRQWPGDEGITTLQPRIKNGSKVEVLIGDELVITGWVEATPVRYDARSVSTGIAGRSLTADLIDCAAEPTQFNGRSLVQIVQALAAPFGIEVVNSGAPSGVIPDVQPDHGETVIEVINKILGQQQALAYDDPHGRLVIGGIGSTRAHTALVLGENILSCDTEKSIRERFSVYQVAGQRAGNDDDFGEATTTALRARTEDAFIARYRPMYIRQTGQATGAGCIARADFEARQRAARTDETTYVVQGWRQGNGTLWQPNQRVIVFDPVCGFDNTELLVSEVTFTQDQNGTLTEIRVGPPDAYLPEPEDPGARKKKKARVQEDPF
ncbi:TPA: baseplate protein [Escherichia coli]|nr:baseplate protein [Escherichia coli]